MAMRMATKCHNMHGQLQGLFQFCTVLLTAVLPAMSYVHAYAAALHQHSSTSAAHMYSRAHSEQQSAAAQQRRRTAPQYSSCSAAALVLVLRKTARQRCSYWVTVLLFCSFAVTAVLHAVHMC